MNFIPVNEPLLNGNEKKYLNECIDSGWISSEGPFVELFEKNMAEYVGRKYAIAVSNGTAAIDAVIEAYGFGPGDEIIMPTFTIISCINQIVRSGALPVLIDCDINTWNMDVTQIESKITKNTKAIMIVHIYGLPVDVDPILEIAKKYNLKIIEDAAEMHGQNYKNKPCGSFGDVSIFSFYPNKHITTGEGGMILTDNEELFLKCKSLRNLCFKPEKRFVHESLGWNLRMTNLQAAIGLAQLERIDEFVAKKRKMGQQYNKHFSELTTVQLPLESISYANNIYWVYGMLIKKSVGITSEEIMKKLSQLGIGCRPFFCPMHQQPILKKMGFFKNEKYPISDLLYKYGFYIPSGMALEDTQIDKVATTVKTLLQ
jgi:perosamine synthetase